MEMLADEASRSFRTLLARCLISINLICFELVSVMLPKTAALRLPASLDIFGGRSAALVGNDSDAFLIRPFFS